MLKQQMTDALNQQINLEFFSSNLYLQMSSWCETNGYSGSAAFLKEHAAEELEHMHRLFKYVNEAGGMSILGAIEAPATEYKDIIDIFTQTYEHELLISSEINNLVALAFELKDFTSFNFLQWYITEQLEEEALFQGILDKIKLLGNDSKNMFFFDKEILNLVEGEVSEEE